jgi:serine-type D-Ala-D-Ala carboxypeptidase/endopeptidase
MARRTALASLAILLLTAVPSAPAAPTTSPSTAPATRPAPVPRADVDALVQPLIDGEWCPGVVVGWVTPEESHVYGYGRFSAKDGRRPDGRTVFEIGSITKVFTSLLLANEVNAGRMSLDDPVQKYLPDSVKMPRKGDRPITLQDLATHTSGLPRMPNNFHPKDPSNPYADYTVDRLYEFLNACRPARAPGEAYEYSNVGVGLLGHVITREAGQDYQTLLRERITRPLGMIDTRVTLDDDLRRRLPPGHDADGAPQPNWDLAALVGAGGIRSTADDLLRFASAQLGLGHVDGDLAAAIALTHVHRTKGIPNADLGLAWHFQDGRILTHSGQTGGYHSTLMIDPQNRTAVVVLTNAGTGMIDEIGKALMERLAGKPLRPLKLPPAVRVDPKTLESYAGHYLLGLTGIMTITRDGDRLYAQIVGQPRFRIYPGSDKNFYWRVVAAKVDFETDETGKVRKLVLHQNGKDITGRRIRPEETAP